MSFRRERRVYDRWLVPEEILLEGEDQGKLERLFDEMADMMASGGEDTPSSLIAARAATMELWAYDRESSNAEDLMEHVVRVRSVAIARRNAYRSMDDRQKMRSMAIANVKQAIDVNDTLRRRQAQGDLFAIHDGENVVSFRKSS